MSPSLAKRIGIIAGVASAYWLAGWFGLSLAAVHPSASAVWPPTGIAIASVMLWRRDGAFGVFIGAALVNLPGLGPLALLVASGNTAEALAAVWILDRLAGPSLFTSHRGLAAFFLAAAVAPVASATIGVTALWLAGDLAGAPVVWATWWVGDTLGALLVAPAVYLAFRPVRAPRLVEPTSAAVVVVLIGIVTFIQPWPGLRQLPLAFLPLPAVIWLAMRGGVAWTAWSGLAFAAVGLYGTVTGTGPFAQFSPVVNVVVLQAYLVLVQVSGLEVALASRRRRLAELRLAAANEEMERRVERRTRDLQEAYEKLRKAQDAEVEMARLRDQDAFKSAFLNTAAHELATPMTPLRLQVALLQKTMQGSGDQARVAVIDRNLSRLSRLVADMLEVARIQSGRVPLEIKPASLRAIVAEVVDMYNAQAARQGVTIIADVPDIQFEADAQRLSQVLINLVSNALKFTAADGTVTIRASVDGDVRIVVSDTGLGMDVEQLSRLFRPFERVHEDHDAPGTGLGLSICKGFVEAHGGTIRAHSDGPGRGSRFEVVLPARGVRVTH